MYKMKTLYFLHFSLHIKHVVTCVIYLQTIKWWRKYFELGSFYCLQSSITWKGNFFLHQSCSVCIWDKYKYILKSNNLIEWGLRTVAYKVNLFLNDAFPGRNRWLLVHRLVTTTEFSPKGISRSFLNNTSWKLVLNERVSRHWSNIFRIK